MPMDGETFYNLIKQIEESVISQELMNERMVKAAQHAKAELASCIESVEDQLNAAKQAMSHPHVTGHDIARRTEAMLTAIARMQAAATVLESLQTMVRKY